MLNFMKNLNLLIYFMISLFFMEVILKFNTTGNFLFADFLLSATFSISVALVYFILSNLFRSKTNFYMSIILLGLSSVLFASQLVYYNFFKTFYSAYSAGNAGQVFEFWKDIFNIMISNFPWIFLLFLPLILLIVYGRKYLNFKKLHYHNIVILFFSIFLVHFISLGTIYAGGKEQHSPYDLYFNSRNSILSTEKLGLLTTMRLDLQRLVFNWKPVLAASPLPEPPIYIEDEEDSKEEEKTDYNIIDIDFEELFIKEEDETLKEMHDYFGKVEPTAKNSYTGKFKGYNLIFITAESFSPYAVHEGVTPTLYKLVNEGYKFTNFYNPFWDLSTSDGEYVACTSLIPKSGVWSFYESGSNYLPFVMGNQLKNLGYNTKAYHNHTYTYYKRHISHPNMGYDYKGIGNGLKVKKTWPASDLEMMKISTPEYVNKEPFHAYYMTVSGHMQYNFLGNNIASKNKKLVQNLPYSQQAKAYLATQIELDKALEHLLKQLEEAGVSDNTLIALSADHYPYGLDEETLDELAGHPVERNFELYKSPFIIYAKNMKPETIDKPSSSLDIIPTLSNLLGLEYDSRLLMGRDIFSASEPLVLFLNKSFITDKGSYNAITKDFIPSNGEAIDPAYIKWMSSVVDSKFYYSAKILETDYYGKILKSNK